MIQVQVIGNSTTILALWLQSRRMTQGQWEGFRAATAAFFSNSDHQTLGLPQALDVLGGRSVLYYPQHHCRRACGGFCRRHRLCTLGTLGTWRRRSNIRWVRILYWGRSQSTSCRPCTRPGHGCRYLGKHFAPARSRAPNRRRDLQYWAGNVTSHCVRQEQNASCCHFYQSLEPIRIDVRLVEGNPSIAVGEIPILSLSHPWVRKPSL